MDEQIVMTGEKGDTITVTLIGEDRHNYNDEWEVKYSEEIQSFIVVDCDDVCGVYLRDKVVKITKQRKCDKETEKKGNE